MNRHAVLKEYSSYIDPMVPDDESLLTQLCEHLHRSGFLFDDASEPELRRGEEVIRDFERRQVTRRTVERQQRILTRMLDAQKSLRQQDMSEKRRAITAGDFEYEGPDGLPSDLGQRRNLAIEALNSAMKGGYPRAYQAMIRRYFNSLAESEDLINENINENRQ